MKQSGGVYYAEVEPAVNFPPGDNFRVVALPELDWNDTATGASRLGPKRIGK